MQRFELQFTDPKSVVLPLDDIPIIIANPVGFEPASTILETVILPLDEGLIIIETTKGVEPI